MASIDDQVRVWKERLQGLRLQAAKYGDSVDPRIPMEIEDLQKSLSKADEIRQQLGLLDTYRRNVTQLLRQRAMQSDSHVSVSVLNQIASARQNIAQIKEGLWKYYKYRADDEAVDTEQPVREPASMPMLTPEDDFRDMLRQGLRTLEEMVLRGQQADALNQIRMLKRLVQ